MLTHPIWGVIFTLRGRDVCYLFPGNDHFDDSPTPGMARLPHAMCTPATGIPHRSPPRRIGSFATSIIAPSTIIQNSPIPNVNPRRIIYVRDQKA